MYTLDRKLRMGMVGGGRDAFIGPIHRIAAQMDNKIELVCGAFSSTPEKSRLSGQDLLLPPERVYGTYQEMLEAEASLPGTPGWTSSPSSRPTARTFPWP